jgi:hypothetical protein
LAHTETHEIEIAHSMRVRRDDKLATYQKKRACVCAEAFPTQKGTCKMKHAIIAGAMIAVFYNLGSVVSRKET